MENTHTQKRKAVNVTIRQDILLKAKSLNLNTSRAAEHGLIQAIKKEQELLWLEENKDGITAYNDRIKKEGPLFIPDWLEQD